MTDIERVLLLMFGLCMVVSLAMIVTMFRVIRHEHNEGHTQARNLAIFWLLGSIGLGGQCATRVVDGLRNVHFAGSTPAALIVFLTLLWLSWTGFHWYASRSRPTGWRIYLAAVVLWVIVVAWPSFA